MTFVSDAAAAMLSCYDAALQEGPNPPPDDNICFRVGEVPFSAGTAEDLCCEGLAWVRVLRIYPSVNFPNQDTRPNDCQDSSYAIELELGAVRCLPFGTNAAGPSCDQWTAVFIQVDEDAASMRRAVCCMRDLISAGDQVFVEQVVMGEWTPIDGQGGCIGGSMPVTLHVSCNECVETP